MKRFVLFLFVILASTALADSEQDYKTTLMEKNNLLESRELQDERIMLQYDTLDLSDCILPSPLPAVPGSPNYQFTSSWYDDSMNFTLWRQPCTNNAAKSAVLMRVVPYNEPFLCSSSFTVIQNHYQFDSLKIVDTPDGYSFCDDLYVPMTFLLEQWSFYTQFDDQKEFTLIHDGYLESNSVLIPEYSYTPEPIEPPEPVDNDIIVVLEEPANNRTVTGIGNLRGWAVAPYGIVKIEFYIDGEYKFDIPYGGRRADVGRRYPTYLDSEFSGFGMTWSYSRTVDNYTYTVRAVDKGGLYKEVSANITTALFHTPFISTPDPINLSTGQIYGSNNNIILDDITVDGSVYDLMLEWSTPSQGFEIREITPQ